MLQLAVSLTATGTVAWIWRKPFPFALQACALVTAAHSIFSFISDGHDAWAANVARLNPHAKIDFLPARPPPDYPSHATDFMLDHLRAGSLGIGQQHHELFSPQAGYDVIGPAGMFLQHAGK